MHLYQMTEFLSRVFGPSYHFAYYDAEDLAARRATFAVGEENLQLSAACAELVRKFAVETPEANQFYQLALEESSAPGYRNNVFFFKKEDGSLDGVFVVSEHFASKLKLMSEIEAMFNLKAEALPMPAPANEAEVVAVSISSLPRLVRQLMEELSIESGGNLSPDQKEKLINKLREHGAFKLKGAVPTTAQLLNTSIPTVYRYLNKLDQQGNYTSEIYGETIRLL